MDRIHVGLRYELEENVEAEILGLGPFSFLPATRRSPIMALEIRTKSDRHKHRGRSKIGRSHLADIEWPAANKTSVDKAWEQSQEARQTILGGDDSAARARITFAIPRTYWDGHES